MKKFLSGGKIWTILSALIFFMTCGLVVYATSNLSVTSRYTDWKTTSSDKKLEESEWNTLMDKLQYDAIPQGAIIAFSGSCPAGWSRFSDADGKFLMGASSFGEVGGKSFQTITLTTDNLPPHNHAIFASRRISTESNTDWSIVNRYEIPKRNQSLFFYSYSRWVDTNIKGTQSKDISNAIHPYEGDTTNFDDGSKDSYGFGKTSTEGKAESFRVSTIPPFIGVVYCIKK